MSELGVDGRHNSPTSGPKAKGYISDAVRARFPVGADLRRVVGRSDQMWVDGEIFSMKTMRRTYPLEDPRSGLYAGTLARFPDAQEILKHPWDPNLLIVDGVVYRRSTRSHEPYKRQDTRPPKM